MKKVVIFMLFSAIVTTSLMAQENSPSLDKGTEFILGEVNAEGYAHIDFPRKNVIIKRGAIANFNALEGLKVEVAEVRSKNNTTEVVLKRKDGLNFFRFWPTVTADVDKAIAQGELKILKPKLEESIAEK